MIGTQNQECILLQLFAQSSSISRTLFQLLAPQDIINLRLTSRSLNETLSANGQLLNWLYYSQYLAVQRSYSIDKQSYGLTQQICAQRIWSLCSSSELDFAKNVQQLRETKTRLTLLLPTLIEKQQSARILQQVRRILIDPEPPRPIMRRKTVGECCRSPIQIKLATEGYESPEEVYLSEEDEDLKKSLLDRAQQVIQCVSKSANFNLVLELRYRGQLGNQTQTPTCELLNLAQLILKTTQNYVSSIKIYLEAAKKVLLPIQFLQEFVYRYSMFRHSAVELDEKFQYVFQQFQYAFSEVFAKYPLRPRFNLWRLMMKQWVSSMSGLHQCLNKTSSKVFVQLIQHEIQFQIANQTSDEESYSQFNNCFQLEKFKAPRSAILSTSSLDVSTLATLFQQYTEYLIDVSSNPLNVHWYGSSELRLGKSYTQYEISILTYAREYIDQIVNSFSNEYVKIKLSEFFVEAAINILKPCTASKVEGIYKNEVNKILESIRQNKKCFGWNKDWAFPSHNWSQENQRIKQMNYHRKIRQEAAEELVSFFSLEQTMDLAEINAIASSHKPNQQDQQGEQEEEIEESKLAGS